MNAGRAVAVLMVAIALAACSREEPAEAPARADGSPSAQGAVDTPPAEAQPAILETRSLEREHVGWRFRIDMAALDNGRVRLDVLATPATVDAPPMRMVADDAGELVDAFATDLDGDAWPELLLWWRDGGSLAEGRIGGWRFTEAASWSPMILPPLDGDLATGWRGRDQFGVQGNRLVRSFALYRDEDDNATPTAGFVRVIRYRMQGKAFLVDDTALEPMAGTPQAELLTR